jgi:protein gp37
MKLPGLWGPNGRRQKTSAAYWRQPLSWNREAELRGEPYRVFCASLADVFEDRPELVPWRAELWELIRRTPWLDWLLLTKRPENIAGMLPPDWGDGWPNVWLGTSVEDMSVAYRIQILAAVPARVHFVSYEPALGPLHEANLDHVEWVIYGGESGPGFRPDDIEWARAMRDRTRRDGIAFWFKQRAGLRPGGHCERLDGRVYHELPPTRWTRQAEPTTFPLL